MKVSLVTDATTEIVSLSEMKLFLKEDLDVEDALITSFIKSARGRLEALTGVSFITKTFDVSFDKFKYYIELPFPPLQSVTSVKLLDSDLNETTITSSNYLVVPYMGIGKGEIHFKASTSIPQLAPYNALKARIVCGYGNSPSNVPEELKTALKLTVAHWYENRESQEIPNEALMIAKSFKVWNL